jgi:hypothetical protein
MHWKLPSDMQHREMVCEVTSSKDANPPCPADMIGVTCDIADTNPIGPSDTPPEVSGQ